MERHSTHSGSESVTGRLRLSAGGHEEPIPVEELGRAMFPPESLDLPCERQLGQHVALGPACRPVRTVDNAKARSIRAFDAMGDLLLKVTIQRVEPDVEPVGRGT